MDKQDVIVQFPLVVAEPVPLPEAVPVAPEAGTDAWAFTPEYIPREHRAVVGQATQAIHIGMANIVENLFEIGKQLTLVKELIEHGTFRTWVDVELRLQERTAQRLMNVYRRLGQKANIFKKVKPTALYELAMPSTPEKAIAMVEDRVRAGQRLSVQQVFDLIAACKRPAQHEEENQESTGKRLADALRLARTALSHRTVADCEQLLGEQAAARLDELRMDLAGLLEQVQSRLPRARRRTAAEVIVVSASAPAAPVQRLSVADAVAQLPGAETIQTIDDCVVAGEQIVLGCTVFVREADVGQEACYTLVEHEPGRPEAGSISWESPVAQALWGKRVGEIATAKTPEGIIRLAITGIRFPDGRLAESRKVAKAESRLIDTTPRPAQSALTATGGFLEGFTHTLNPYTGCLFGCKPCYVQELPVHRCHKPQLAWGDYAHPRTGIAECLERELQRFAAKDELEALAIFMSSATDPYQGVERRERLTRACLEVMTHYPPGLLIVQTRSPLVQDDYALLRRLGERCWLNMTVETDLESVRKALTPRCPSIPQRLVACRAALEMDLNVQVVVSPCLPYSDVESFGTLLLGHSQRVIVDTYVSGDGMGGKRTAKTDTPDIYTAQGWGDWRNEQAARMLYQWLEAHMGERAGWSQAGFTALAKQVSALPQTTA